MRWLIWKNWSVRTRLLVIAIFPVIYLFLSVITYSYYSRVGDVKIELTERAEAVATALAQGAEYNVLVADVEGLRQMLSAVVQSDRNIFRIEIVDAQQQKLVQVETQFTGKPDSILIEKPIARRLVWVKLLGMVDAENPSQIPSVQSRVEPKSQTGILGFVKVTMSSTYLMRQQMQRFFVELLIAMLALGVSVWVGLFLSGSLTRPLKESIEALRDIRAGDTTLQVALTTGGEIGALQQSINDMAHSLHQAKQSLEHKVEERTHELMVSRNEVMKSDAEKRKLIQKVNTIVEEERKNIAVEIHDELNASLIAIRLEAERIARLANTVHENPNTSENLPEIAQRARAVIKLSLDLYANGRNLVRRLRPEVLDVLGLHGAVEEMLRTYHKLHPGCDFQFSSAGDFSLIQGDMAISAYRIMQEASSNIIKHANANEVKMHMEANNAYGILTMRIEDNGVGFHPEAITPGIGITGMRERVLALQGSFQLSSIPDSGTQIIITLPYGHL
jgi:two-component system, NarL family, sensor histidine kinase UhpB